MSSYTTQATNPFAMAERYVQISFTTTKESANIAEPYFDDVALSVSAFEVDEDRGIWKVDIVTDQPLDDAEITRRLNLLVGATGDALPQASSVDVEPEMWQHNLHQFPAISIGRYLVHGSHLKPTLNSATYPICVDAGMAFGSGEHATTEGCLQLFDKYLLSLSERQAFSASEESAKKAGEGSWWLNKKPSPQPSPKGRGGSVHILDMGCGSAILAMAAAKRLPQSHIVGVDIDKVSIDVAKENARLNGVTKQLKLYNGNGYLSRAVIESAPYDIIFANILARPLMQMAKHLAKHLDEDGVAIISGLLSTQETMVLGAHRLVGLRLVRRWHKDGWSALMLRKN